MTYDKSSPISLYIHIPFCQSKCGYCDFNSFSGLEQLIPRYIDALIREIHLRFTQIDKLVSTIYFGGGTPSLFSAPQIEKIVDACRRCFHAEINAELTLEANPGSITLQGLTVLRNMGFNRLSLGFQSLDDSELRLLGRIHTANQAIEVYNGARKAGFENINIDLIYGLPGQSISQWQKTLNKALLLSPEHFSLYPLTLEETTPLGYAVETGSIPTPDPDLAAEMYLWAEDHLDTAGYTHYEISNWSRPGKDCRHNLTYWKNMPYMGCGAGAHSFLNNYRSANIANPEEYILSLEANRLPDAEREFISPALELSETIILGLRMEEGVGLNEIKLCFGVNVFELYKAEIEELQKSGLLEADISRLRLTHRGRLLGNEVFCRFLPKATTMLSG